MSAHTDYWSECISCSLDELGVTLTAEQIEAIARDVQVAHENSDLAFGTPSVSAPRSAAQRGDADAVYEAINGFEHARTVIRNNLISGTASSLYDWYKSTGHIAQRAKEALARIGRVS